MTKGMAYMPNQKTCMEVYNHLRDKFEAKSIDKLRAAFS